MNGNTRRKNGDGRRPGDTTLRVSRELVEQIARLRRRDPAFASMSVDTLLPDMLDGFEIRHLLHRVPPSDEVQQLRRIALQEIVHTPSPGRP
jgi:hypothetical protein